MIRQVEPLCKLLSQNRETLTSLEFIHCKLSSTFISAICASLHEKDIHTSGIQRFYIKASSFDIDPLAAPPAFISFLNSVRYSYELMPERVSVKCLLIWLSKSMFLINFLVSLCIFFLLSGPYSPYIFAIATSIGISQG